MYANRVSLQSVQIEATSHSQGFTLVTQTYDRTFLLPRMLEHYANCRHLSAIVIIDNHPDHPVYNKRPSYTIQKRNDTWIPITVIPEDVNSMNNRFRPRPGIITTDAVFLIDDDLFVDPADVDFGFEIWTRHASQLVGMLPRAHVPAINGRPISYSYLPAEDGRYSIILAGASFFSVKYMDLYWSPDNTHLRQYVDAVFNCDDLLLNFVIAKAASRPPVLVRALVTDYVVKRDGGLAHGSGWTVSRHKCMEDLADRFGGVPLQWNSVAYSRDTSQSYAQKYVSLSPHDGHDYHTTVGIPMFDITAAPSLQVGGASLFEFPEVGRLELSERKTSSATRFSPCNPFTVEAWYRPASRVWYQSIVSIGQVRLGIDHGQARVDCGNVRLQYQRRLSANRYSHLAAVYDGKTCCLYVNGRIALRRPSLLPACGRHEHSFITVGALGPGTGSASGNLEGSLQEVRIWSRARSTREIQSGMSRTLNPSPSTIPVSLALHIPMGGVVKDSTGRFDIAIKGHIGLTSGIVLESSQDLDAALLVDPYIYTELVTVVLTSFKRPENIQKIITHITEFFSVSGDFVIWNNNVDVAIDPNELHSPWPIRLVNSHVNMFTEAKYQACLAGRHDICYIQDDDFYPSCLNALYASFRSSPHLIHATTDMDTTLINQKWTFFNQSIGLHAGFTWLGTGAFVHKNLIRDFLRQLDAAGLEREDRHLADLYFSVWQNQLPVVLPVPLNTTDLEQTHAFSCSDCKSNRERNLEAFRKAVRVLVRDLAHNKSDGIFQRKKSVYHKERDIKCACLDDSCIFLTNIHTWPDVSLIPFNAETDLEERTIKGRIAPITNSTTYYAAVDGDDRTAWVANRSTQAGDYLALDLLTPRVISGFNVIWNMQKHVAAVGFEVSMDGMTWQETDCHVASMKNAKSAFMATNVSFVCPATRMRGIRLVFNRNIEAMPIIWEMRAVDVELRPDASRQVAYVVTGTLDDIRASGEVRGLVHEAWTLARAGFPVTLISFKGNPLEDEVTPNRDTLARLLKSSGALFGAATLPTNLILKVIESDDTKRMTSTPSSSLMRRSLDLHAWWLNLEKSGAEGFDVVYYSAWKSPMAFVLRAHRIGIMARKTIFAARVGRLTVPMTRKHHKYLGFREIEHSFFEQVSINMADALAFGNAAVWQEHATRRWNHDVAVHKFYATSDEIALSSRYSCGQLSSVRQIVVVITPDTSDHDRSGFASTILRATVEAGIGLHIFDLRKGPASISDVLAYAQKANDRLTWILDGSSGGSFYVAKAIEAGLLTIAPHGALPISLANDSCVTGYEDSIQGLSQVFSRIVGERGVTLHANVADVAPTKPALPYARSYFSHDPLLYVTELVLTRKRLLPGRLSPFQPSDAPLVTVCIPTYNRSDYLEATIASVLASNYPNFEIIVVDDGSASMRDVSYLSKLEADFRARGPGWMVLRQHHKYASAARNLAIDNARGKYVLMFDDDDFLRPDAIFLMVATAERLHAHVVVGWVEAFENPSAEISIHPSATRHIWAGAGASAALGMFGNAYGGGSALILTEAARRVGGYHVTKPGVAHLDYEFLSRLVTSGHRLELLPRVVYDYRVGSRGSIFGGRIDAYADRLFSLEPYKRGGIALAESIELAFLSQQ